MQKRVLLGFVSGAVLAIVAVVLVKIYLDQQRQEMESEKNKAIAQIKDQAQQYKQEVQKNQSAVLVAKQDIPKGTLIEASMLEAAIFPNQEILPQTVVSFDRIAGMETVAAISKGEQVTLGKLTFSREKAKGFSLSMATPIGKRAVTIPIDSTSSVGGMVRPGDYVDVLCTIPVPVQTADGKKATQETTLPIFQNILVLAIGQELGAPQASSDRKRGDNKEAPREVAPIITLALSPQEANLLIFVQEQSKIRLALRSPADSKIQELRPASWETLFQYLVPQESGTEEASSKGKPAKREIQIYRGFEKEVVPLSK